MCVCVCRKERLSEVDRKRKRVRHGKDRQRNGERITDCQGESTTE